MHTQFRGHLQFGKWFIYFVWGYFSFTNFKSNSPIQYCECVRLYERKYKRAAHTESCTFSKRTWASRKKNTHTPSINQQKQWAASICGHGKTYHIFALNVWCYENKLQTTQSFVVLDYKCPLLFCWRNFLTHCSWVLFEWCNTVCVCAPM